jgi:predicted DNA binding CopG/RHH family protein
MKREKSVTIRLSDAESERLKKLSAERDLPMSIVLRQLLRVEEGLPTQVSLEDAEVPRKA